jgi:hypothetical protein
MASSPYRRERFCHSGIDLSRYADFVEHSRCNRSLGIISPFCDWHMFDGIALRLHPDLRPKGTRLGDGAKRPTL